MTDRKSLRAMAFGALVATAGWASVGALPAPQDPGDRPPVEVEVERQSKAEQVGERVGEAVGRTADVISNRARKLGAEVEAAFNRARSEIKNFGVEARITGRLTWDKDLQGSRIELDVDDRGVAVLRGSVPDAAAKVKAVMLTRDTVGVRSVEDQLKVTEPAPTESR